MSDVPHRDPTDERVVLAKLLSTNAEFLAEVLRPAEGKPVPSVLAALRAARSLDGVVDDVLRSLVRQARDEGRTWAEIGEIFGTSRQAAFQRFGGAGAGFPIPPVPPIPPMPEMPRMPMPEMPPMPEPPDWSKMPGMPKLPGMPNMPWPFRGHEHHGPGPHGPDQHGHRHPGPMGPAAGRDPHGDEPGE
ncbi:hypothetical protein GPX89_14905 [Nocardia sp. ET3-3]|uniref:Uncharacterized protein n=1 Tax=Nocardia terrae TaxID=2675851 RepID=A0A7K1UW90_9NOCA|nr:hypothetical protein [Nocardia terrae]MVU78531.1 hypothetical protein [Nocardia terrae]